MVHGSYDPRFSPVKEAFAANFTERGEVGASFAATLDGRSVIDLWAGYADAARSRPWEGDTLACLYSTTKGLAALSALLLVDRGLLDLEAPVARYWPEFAQAGKQDLPVKYLLSHQSGLAWFEPPIAVETLFDWEGTVNLLAAQAPGWKPGTQSGYHALTQGYLVGEVVRRITHQSIGAFFHQEIARPLQADLHIGLAPEHNRRLAEMIPPPASQPGDPGYAPLPERIWKSMAPLVDRENPVVVSRRRAWRAAEIPSGNGYGNARSLARMAAALAYGEVDGFTLLRPATIDKAFQEQSYGIDYIIGLPVRWALGFILVSKELPLSPNPHTLFSFGGGGSAVGYDRDAQLSFAYVMNNCLGSVVEGDERAASLVRALYAAF